MVINVQYALDNYGIAGYSLMAQVSAQDTGGTNCPTETCDAGGCGSSQCSISQDYPVGIGSSRSVTAQEGYFACCWKDDDGDLFAASYPNSCCEGMVGAQDVRMIPTAQVAES